ncbi:Histone-lysine n-methyltransferase setd1a [Balamuthia mandrillaris]
MSDYSTFVELVNLPYGTGVLARKNFRKGELVLPLEGYMIDHAEVESIQVTYDSHLFLNGIAYFVNHCCDPNVYPDLTQKWFVAVRDIAVGEQLGFNYLSTEWDMARPFECCCGTNKCYGRIAGFKYLTPEVQQSLKEQLSPFLLTKLALLDAPLFADSVTMIDTPYGVGVYAARDFDKGEVVLPIQGRKIPSPIPQSIQIDESQHCQVENLAYYVNHCCDANVFVEYDKMNFVASKPIKKGEQITFNYLCTEWEMNKPFNCNCKSSSCYGEVAGFKFLQPHQKEALMGQLSPFLLQKLSSA